MMDYEEIFEPTPEAVPIDVERLVNHWKDGEYWALRGKLKERDYNISEDIISDRAEDYLEQGDYGKLEELYMLSESEFLDEKKLEEFYTDLLDEGEYHEMIKFHDMTGKAPELDDGYVEKVIDDMIGSEEFDKLPKFLNIYGEESLSSGKIFESFEEMIMSGEPVKAFSLSDHVPYDIPGRLVDIGFKKYALEGRKDLVEKLRTRSCKEVPSEVSMLLSGNKDFNVAYISESADGKDV